MKQPRYKIYKQVGIHDLVPFKSNVKLFRHLLVAKYTFLYFFHREYVNRKFNRLRINLKRFLHPFIAPESKKLFSDLGTDNKSHKKYQVLNLKFSNFKDYVYEYSRHTQIGLNPPRFKYFRRPKRYFKKRYTKLPKKNVLVNSELLHSYFSLFPTNEVTSSTLNYNSMKNPLLNFFLMTQKLYLKLSFVNLEQTQIKFEKMVQSIKLSLRILNLVKKLKKLTNSFQWFLQSSLVNNYRVPVIMLLKRLKQLIGITLYKVLRHRITFQLSGLSSTYYYTKRYNLNKCKVTSLRNELISDFTDEHFNNIGWFSLMDYFFPKFVQSGYQIFMHKDFMNKFLINPYIYKKYLSELARSETFIQFSRNIMNYKQQRSIKKFFVQLYRQRYRKIRYKPFHGLGSYYRVTYKIMSFLLNRPVKRYRFNFNTHRLKLFQNKLIKVLYKVKRSKDCTKIKKLKENQSYFSKINNTNITNWYNDIVNYSPEKLKLFKNNHVFNIKDGIVLGDQFKVLNRNLFNYRLDRYESFNFYRLVHFYLNIFPLFENNKLTLFRSFGKYYFFLDTIKYKLGYLFSKHFYKSLHSFKTNNIDFKLKKNTVPLIENNQIYYAHISSPYLYFNQRYIFMGEPFNLERANLDEFYRYRFSLLRGKPIKKRKNTLLQFLNYYQYDIPHYMKIYHNKFHILRYIQFIKGIKNFITLNFNYSLLIGKYSIIVTNTEMLYGLKHPLDQVRQKIHANKVEELIVGSDNFNSIQPK